MTSPRPRDLSPSQIAPMQGSSQAEGANSQEPMLRMVGGPGLVQGMVGSPGLAQGDRFSHPNIDECGSVGASVDLLSKN